MLEHNMNLTSLVVTQMVMGLFRNSMKKHFLHFIKMHLPIAYKPRKLTMPRFKAPLPYRKMATSI